MKFTTLFEARLTPAEEVSDAQLATFARHKRNGTSPGNPKWYRPLVVRPFKFDGRVVLPKIETGAQWHHHNRERCPDSFNAVHAGMDVKTYVQLFEQARGLKGQVDFAEMRRRGIIKHLVKEKRLVVVKVAA